MNIYGNCGNNNPEKSHDKTAITTKVYVVCVYA